MAMGRHDNSLFSITNSTEAEAILRSHDFSVDADALTYVLDLFFKAGDEDTFYTVMLDFFEIAQTTEWFPKDEAKREMFIEGIYGLMYNKKDVDRAVRAAAILADYRKSKGDHFEIFALIGDLRKLCGNPVSNSTYFIIVKEAISSAVSVIENAVDEGGGNLC